MNDIIIKELCADAIFSGTSLTKDDKARLIEDYLDKIG